MKENIGGISGQNYKEFNYANYDQSLGVLLEELANSSSENTEEITKSLKREYNGSVRNLTPREVKDIERKISHFHDDLEQKTPEGEEDNEEALKILESMFPFISKNSKQ